eukprot:Gregarina_sp_Poly_1__7543@NODE_421_length_8662_cov_273_710646_g343_i0_p2_GENE_NODE_421_length_8662_cov_273_710646_g343_i0NODE_421_length_8662_cov_273_710646_g343_i0_p2_ORF_typecomplete_len475_score21_68PAN_4/PF14295_6/1_1e04PAN_4/PF14295_6/5_4e03PAN_4/PF14295_6/0_031PAN_4/PF14295_6/4_6e03PAN_4/PF14295_6/1_3e03PAN_4/PF14295_6/3e06PAN_4/PF14295_6/1_1e04_NODE_421_length_8662_cov_273_710646_g343_i01401564
MSVDFLPLPKSSRSSRVESSQVASLHDQGCWLFGQKRIVWSLVSLALLLVALFAVTTVSFKVLYSSSHEVSHVTTNVERALKLCGNAVSRAAGHTNRYCRSLCISEIRRDLNPNGNATFATWCFLEPWAITYGVADLSAGSCYDHWVHGNYIQAAPESCGLTPTLYTDTPADCQYMCQTHRSCVRWIWGVSSLHVCCLLNGDAVVSAVNSLRDADFSNTCGAAVSESCYLHEQNCLVCEAQRRCVWHSTYYIGGWKYCTPQNLCAGEWQFPFDPLTVDVNCENAVSTEVETSNAQCHILCRTLQLSNIDPMEVAEFNTICTLIDWFWDLNSAISIVSSGYAFDHWIHGPIDGNHWNYSIARNPADCQALCQAQTDCVRWIWNVDPTSATYQRCWYKNADQIERAANVKFSDSIPPNVSPSDCSYDILEQCINGDVFCGSCPDDLQNKRCIWWSDTHIAGWREAVHMSNLCEVPS